MRNLGLVARDALLGLEEVGAAEVREILAEATRRLGGSPSFDRDERQTQLSDYYVCGGSFDDLDDHFYALAKTVDLESVVMSYIRNNAAAFLYEGVVTKPPRRHS